MGCAKFTVSMMDLPKSGHPKSGSYITGPCWSCWGPCRLFCVGRSAAQENFLVSTEDGVLSLYDLASYAKLQSVRSAYPYAYSLVPSPNPRLAFVPGEGIVADLSIARQVAMIRGVSGSIGAMTKDGKSLLIVSAGSLEFVDPVQFSLVKTVDLTSVLGGRQPGALVVTATNAYVFPQFAFPSEGRGCQPHNLRGLFAFAADGNLQQRSRRKSGRCHTGWKHDGRAGDRNRGQQAACNLYQHRLKSNHWRPGSIVGFQLYAWLCRHPRWTGSSENIWVRCRVHQHLRNRCAGFAVEFADVWADPVRYRSPLDASFGAQSMVVNSDGSRLIVVGSPQAGNSPNTLIVDTAKMFSDPSHAIIQSLTSRVACRRHRCAPDFS